MQASVTEWSVGKLVLQRGSTAGKQAVELDPMLPRLQYKGRRLIPSAFI